MIASLSLLLLAAAWGAEAAAPRSWRQLAGEGLVPQRVITDTVAGVPLTAVLLRHPRQDRDELAVFARAKGRDLMVFLHPGAADRLTFDGSMAAARGFPEPFGRGERFIVYRAAAPGLHRTLLHLLRVSGLRVRRIGTFPEGSLRDLDNDGRSEIISRTLPLGRFSSFGCAGFSTMSQTAFQTRVSAWDGEAFVDASERFPDFFSSDIARLEEALPLIPKERRPGEYLGAALSLYFDHAAQGRRRQGWQRLSALLQPPPRAPRKLAQCLADVKSRLAQELSIPSEWR